MTLRESLTPRETQVAELAAAGKGAAEIGRALGITSGTVKNTLHRAYEKLGLSGPGAQVQLMARAKELLTPAVAE